MATQYNISKNHHVDIIFDKMEAAHIVVDDKCIVYFNEHFLTIEYPKNGITYKYPMSRIISIIDINPNINTNNLLSLNKDEDPDWDIK